MFEDKDPKAEVGVKAADKKSVAPALDIVIHSFPKEFYNREVKLDEPVRPATKVVTPVPAVPATVPLPREAAPKMVPKAVTAPRRRSRRWPLALLALFLLVAVSTGAYIGYTQGLFEDLGFAPASTVPTPIPNDQTPVVPDPITPVPTPEPAQPISGADTDSDGLTNVEELLYGTDFRNPDSDGDTYLDGNEVFHRFDPRGLAPSTLLDTGAVRVLEGVDLPFTIYYPTTWNPVSTPASQRVSFRSATGAGVNIVWQDKAEATTLEAWYTAQVGEVELNRLQATTTKEGYKALIGPDERVTYVEANGRVYTVMYDLGDAKSIEFLQTFKMMINSFKLQS